MRKSLLFLSFILSAAWGYSQSFTLSSYVISISGDRDSLLHSTAVLHNNSANTIDVAVDKIDGNLVGTSYSYFCWAGQCYNQFTFTSPFTTMMAPGDSSIPGTQGFIAYLQPDHNVGNNDVTYSFYDVNNQADSVNITFNYTALVTGIREIIASGVVLSNPMPNPAGSFTQIAFNAPAGRNARLVVYNMLGLKVKEIPVNGNQKLMSLNTADLRNGLYIYSLVTDEKVMASKKLVVNHK